MQVTSKQDQQTLTRLHGEYLADADAVTTSAVQLQDDAYALGYKRAGIALAGASVRVTAEGVSFGNSWFSHESITGRTAEQLNSGKCGIIRREYKKWVDSSLNPEAQALPLVEQFCFCGEHVSLQMISGGAAPCGYLGEVTLLIDGGYVRYARVSDGGREPLAWQSKCVCGECLGSEWSDCTELQYRLAMDDEEMQARQLYAEPVATTNDLAKAHALLAKIMQAHVSALPKATRAEIEALIA